MDFPGCVYHYDPENDPSNRTCGCSINDECYPHEAINPDNSCLICDIQISSTAWSPRPPVDCDDNDACTYGDSCSSNGVCVGVAYSCAIEDAPCVESSTCNGAGQCDLKFKSASTLCSSGDGYCQPDRFCSGKHGYCPPRSSLLPTVTAGQIKIVMDDFVTSSTFLNENERKDGENTLINYSSPSLTNLYVSVTDWNVRCGFLDFSIGWYADPSMTLGCSNSYVTNFSTWQRGEGLPVNVSSPLLAETEDTPSSTNEGTFTSYLSLPLLSPSVDDATILSPLTEAVWITTIVKARNIKGKEFSYCVPSIGVDDTAPVPTGPVRNIDPTASNGGGTVEKVYAHDGTYLAFAWDPFVESLPSSWGGLLTYYWSIGTEQGGADVVPWQYAGVGTSSATTLDEDISTMYYGIPLHVTVRAYNRAGLYSEAYSENSVIIDPTPATDCTVVDGTYSDNGIPMQTSFSSESNAPLSIQLFNCRDRESGLKEYRLCWGSTPGVCDITTLTTYPFLTNDNNIYPLSMDHVYTTIFSSPNSNEEIVLVPGILYYANVWVISGSGASTYLVTSGYTVDVTAPTNFLLVVPEYTSTDWSIGISWNYDEEESPIVSARVWVGTTSRRETDSEKITVIPDVIPVTVLEGFATFDSSIVTVALPVDASSPLIQGKMYYVCSDITNAAGLTSSVSCTGTTIDITPPEIDTVIAVSPTAINGEAILATSRIDLGIAARWDAAIDDLSGIQSYLVRLTTNGIPRYETGELRPTRGPGTIPVTPWTTVQGTFVTLRPVASDDYLVFLDLVPGWTYWITLRITNGAGVITEKNTQGIFAGNGEPSEGTVIIPNSLRYNPDTHSSWWGIGESLTFKFSSLVDVYAGINEYKYAIGTCTKDTVESIVPWTSLGNNNGNTLAVVQVVLSTEQNYCVSVRAISNTGLSVESVSRSFQYDDTIATSDNLFIRDVSVTIGNGFGSLDAEVTISNDNIDIDYSVSYDPSNSIAYIGVVWSPLTDPESKLQAYWVCYGTVTRGECDPDTDDDWVENTVTRWTKAIDGVTIGSRIFVTVCGLNYAGTCTYLMSDGIIVDPSAPTTGHFLFFRNNNIRDHLIVSNETSVPLENDGISLPFYISDHPGTVPLSIGIRDFTTAGGAISKVLLDLGSTTGSVSIMERMDYGTNTVFTLPVSLFSSVKDGDTICPSVTVVGANGLSTRYVSPRCIVYDGSSPTPFTTVVTVQNELTLVSNPTTVVHMSTWPYRNRLRFCLSNYGDEHSGIVRTTVSISSTENSYSIEYTSSSGYVTVLESLSELFPQKVAYYSCYDFTNNNELQLQYGISYRLMITQTNGAGLSTTSTSPLFIMDDINPLDFEVLLPFQAMDNRMGSTIDGTVTVSGSVYVPQIDARLDSIPILFTTPPVKEGYTGIESIDYWGSIGTNPGQTDKLNWIKLINITRSIVVNGPSGKPIRCSRGYFGNESLGTPDTPLNRPNSIPIGRSYINILALDGAGQALVLSGSGHIELTQTMVLTKEYRIGGTIGMATSPLLFDSSVPTFASVPVILSSKHQNKSTLMIVNGNNPSSSTLFGPHANAIRDTSSISVAWSMATCSGGAAIAYYRVCLSVMDFNSTTQASTVATVPLVCKFAGLKYTITFTDISTRISEGTQLIATVEATSTTNITGYRTTAVTTIDTLPPSISGPVYILQDPKDNFSQIKYVSAVTLSASNILQGSGTTLQRIVDLGIAWNASFDNINGTGILLYEAAVGTERGGTQLRFFEPLSNITQTELSQDLIYRASLSGVRLPHGSPVYVTLRATDAAGNIAELSSFEPVFSISLGPSSLGFSVTIPSSPYQLSSDTLTILI